MQGIPHHFIDFISVRENYNAGKFETDVLNFLESYFIQKKLILVTGGSGLYIDAVCNGMDKVPGADVHIRAELLRNFKENGISALLEKLKSLDKKYYDAVDKNNPHRIIRALEVCLISGLPYSSFRKKESAHHVLRNKLNFKKIKIGIELPREELYEKINNRVDRMIENGLVEEAGALLRFKDRNALKTVGYEELFCYLEGKIDLAEAVELIKRNTRRFAKRQMTWFRKDKEIKWFHPEEKEKIITHITSKL